MGGHIAVLDALIGQDCWSESFLQLLSLIHIWMRMWLATMASSCSHQPHRVKVWVVVRPSTSKVTVNCSPSLGSTPSSSNTWVSVAASFVPSWGRRPSTGSQNCQSVSYTHLDVDKRQVHSPRTKFSESVLPLGAAIHATVAVNWLAQNA